VLLDLRGLVLPLRLGSREHFAGFIETMFRNRDMVGNPRFGRLGRFHLVVKTVDTLLPIYGLSAFLALSYEAATTF